METADDQLELARIGVDVAHRVHARQGGLEARRFDREQLAFHLQAPARQRSQARAQPETDEQPTRRPVSGLAGGVQVVDARQLAGGIGAGQRRLADQTRQAALVDQAFEPLDQLGRSRIDVSAIQQGDRHSVFGQQAGPLERPVVAAMHQHRRVCAGRRVGRLIAQAGRLERVEPRQLEPPRCKGAHARGDEDRAGDQLRARRGAEVVAAVVARGQRLDFLAQVQHRCERCHLLQQSLDQFAAGAYRQCRNVVDRLGRVELGTLSTRYRQHIDDMAAQALQTELEDLEQPHRPGADHQGIGFDRSSRSATAARSGGGGGQGLGVLRQRQSSRLISTGITRPPSTRMVQAGLRISSPSLSLRSFHSSASGSAALRLVMLGHLGDSSALMAMNFI